MQKCGQTRKEIFYVGQVQKIQESAPYKPRVFTQAKNKHEKKWQQDRSLRFAAQIGNSPLLSRRSLLYREVIFLGSKDLPVHPPSYPEPVNAASQGPDGGGWPEGPKCLHARLYLQTLQKQDWPATLSLKATST